jgi:hypothetical protein
VSPFPADASAQYTLQKNCPVRSMPTSLVHKQFFRLQSIESPIGVSGGERRMRGAEDPRVPGVLGHFRLVPGWMTRSGRTAPPRASARGWTEGRTFDSGGRQSAHSASGPCVER